MINIDWVVLKNLQKLSFVKRAYVWLIVVPIGAKIIDSVLTIKIEALSDFQVLLLSNYHLPFNWTLLYFSAVSFILAILTLHLSCPKIILENDSYFDFFEKKEGVRKIEAYANNTGLSLDNLIVELGVDKRKIREGSVDSTRLIFDHIFFIAKSRFLKLRRLALSFYTLGIVFVLVVLIQNFIYVIKYI